MTNKYNKLSWNDLNRTCLSYNSILLEPINHLEISNFIRKIHDKISYN